MKQLKKNQENEFLKSKKSSLSKKDIQNLFVEYGNFGANGKGIEKIIEETIELAYQCPDLFKKYLSENSNDLKFTAFLKHLWGANFEKEKNAFLLKLNSVHSFGNPQEAISTITLIRSNTVKLNRLFGIKISQVLKTLENEGMLDVEKYRIPTTLENFFEFIDFIFNPSNLNTVKSDVVQSDVVQGDKAN